MFGSHISGSVKMSSRAPRYSKAEMHAPVEGCIKRWKILSSNTSSDKIKASKKAAGKTITSEVNAMNTGAGNKLEEMRRKLQVEKSNVKRSSRILNLALLLSYHLPFLPDRHFLP